MNSQKGRGFKDTDPYLSFPAVAVKLPPRVAGPRRQQQREPPVDGYRTIPVFHVGLGEGIYGEG